MNYQDQKILIRQLRQGDEKAFEHLVDSYSQRLFAYAITLTNNHVMSQDVVQNVFLKTWEHRKKMDIRLSLQNYLFKSVHNEFINQYKKKKAVMSLEKKYFEALDNVVMAQEEHSVKKKIEKITKEIQGLPPRCKEVFMLSRKEGLTNMEISAHLNISIKTVEAQITKAFATLRKKLGEQFRTTLFLLFDAHKEKGSFEMGSFKISDSEQKPKT